MSKKKILVLGANGKTGKRVVERIQLRNEVEIIMGSRTAKTPFNWENSGTWPAVLNGADTVYITFQPDLAVPAATKIIQEFTLLATRLGVQKMVLLSGRGEKEAQVCEEIVKASAKNWTIVRASWFNQNFSESFFLEPLLAGFVALPRAEALEPFTDADDIAAVVTECLLNDKHNGQTYELTGPELLSFPEAVSIIAKAAEREIKFQSLTLEEYIQMLREYQVPEDYIWLVNYLFEQVLDGRNSSITNDIEKVTGRKPTDFTTYAKETAKSGIWDTADVQNQ
jgi:uncharacterized protein YbjT (DUF2867 family)